MRQRFVEEYCVDLNATQAAIRAGYSPATAEQQGPRLLENVEVRSAIDSILQGITERTLATAENVCRELMQIAFFDPRRLFDENGALKPIHELDRDVSACIASIDILEQWEGKGKNRKLVGHTKKVRLCSKIDALTRLGQRWALWKDRLEHTGKDGGPIRAELVNTLERYGALLNRIARLPGGDTAPDGGAESVHSPSAN